MHKSNCTIHQEFASNKENWSGDLYLELYYYYKMINSDIYTSFIFSGNRTIKSVLITFVHYQDCKIKGRYWKEILNKIFR